MGCAGQALKVLSGLLGISATGRRKPLDRWREFLIHHTDCGNTFLMKV